MNESLLREFADALGKLEDLRTALKANHTFTGNGIFNAAATDVAVAQQTLRHVLAQLLMERGKDNE